jgi:hypothetical protein
MLTNLTFIPFSNQQKESPLSKWDNLYTKIIQKFGFDVGKIWSKIILTKN